MEQQISVCCIMLCSFLTATNVSTGEEVAVKVVWGCLWVEAQHGRCVRRRTTGDCCCSTLHRKAARPSIHNLHLRHNSTDYWLVEVWISFFWGGGGLAWGMVCVLEGCVTYSTPTDAPTAHPCVHEQHAYHDTHTHTTHAHCTRTLHTQWASVVGIGLVR